MFAEVIKVSEVEVTLDYDGPMIQYGFLIRKQEDSPGQVARLEHHFIYQKVVYLIPDRDTHLGCIQSPAGAHREATNGCFYLTSLFSLKSTNISLVKI